MAAAAPRHIIGGGAPIIKNRRRQRYKLTVAAAWPAQGSTSTYRAHNFSLPLKDSSNFISRILYRFSFDNCSQATITETIAMLWLSYVHPLLSFPVTLLVSFSLSLYGVPLPCIERVYYYYYN